ncbi:MAG: hypothetical protein IT364_25655, partial [Candidatus Hydrogenedentes bacterium]|nr:hypothetical protein [Candidatus Hydrogenedentota bacterium]
LQASARADEPVIGWNEVGESLLQPYLAASLKGRFTHVVTVDDLLSAIVAQSRPGTTCWAVVYDGPAGDPRREIEVQLRGRGLRFHRTSLAGLRRLHIYQVTRD